MVTWVYAFRSRTRFGSNVEWWKGGGGLGQMFVCGGLDVRFGLWMATSYSI